MNNQENPQGEIKYVSGHMNLGEVTDEGVHFKLESALSRVNTAHDRDHMLVGDTSMNVAEFKQLYLKSTVSVTCGPQNDISDEL